jgi:5-methylcytosine-specific restriction endonuclease McrA
MDFLFDKRELRKRIDKVYSAMKHRAKPKLWKNGKRRGQVRVPGLTKLPFTSEELWEWAVEWVGTTVSRCPYCEQIGRPANLIDLTNVTFDHKIPLGRGGTWELHNLIPVCAECNREKGSLSYDYFVHLMRDLDKMADQQDKAYMLKCLRTHGVALQAQRFSRNPVTSAPPGSTHSPVFQFSEVADDDDF